MLSDIINYFIGTKTERALRLADKMPDDPAHTLEFYENGGTQVSLNKSDYAQIRAWMSITESAQVSGAWDLPVLSNSDKDLIMYWMNSDENKTVQFIFPERVVNTFVDWNNRRCANAYTYNMRVLYGEIDPWYQPAIALFNRFRFWSK